jgi:hypothetical protein
VGRTVIFDLCALSTHFLPGILGGKEIYVTEKDTRNEQMEKEDSVGSKWPSNL